VAAERSVNTLYEEEPPIYIARPEAVSILPPWNSLYFEEVVIIIPFADDERPLSEKLLYWQFCTM